MIGGNRFAYNPQGGKSPYAPYDVPKDTAAAGAGTKVASLDPNQILGTGKVEGGGAYRSNLDYLTEHGGHDTIGGKSVPAGTPGSYKQEDPEFVARLAAAGEAYTKATGQEPKYGELSRDEATQAVYYNRYIHGRGGIAARPGASRHQGGAAGDLPDSGFRQWLKAGHQSEFGLHFPVRGDAPHVQADPDYHGKAFAGADRSALNEGRSVVDKQSGAGPGAASSNSRLLVACQGAAQHQRGNQRRSFREGENPTAAPSTRDRDWAAA